MGPENRSDSRSENQWEKGTKRVPQDKFAVDRQNQQRRMIETQLRNRGITDERVLEAMSEIPRERFADFEDLNEAYGDFAFGIDCEQTISQPYVVGLMTQALDIEPTHRVLEIGTGSGYQTALLARLAGEVVTIERHGELSAQAQSRLTALELANVTYVIGQGIQGAKDQAPFDRIMVTAAAEDFPTELFEQLSDEGGVMVYPQGPHHDTQMLYKLVKEGQHKRITELCAVRFVPLVSH